MSAIGGLSGSGTTECTITNLGPGEWTFYVTALYENNEESPPSNEVTVNLTDTQDEITVLLPLTLIAGPNPFQNGVNLQIKGLDERERCEVVIYNIKGQIVHQMSFSGKREIYWNWDGKDISGKKVSEGIYFLKATSGLGSLSRKLTLIK